MWYVYDNDFYGVTFSNPFKTKGKPVSGGQLPKFSLGGEYGKDGKFITKNVKFDIESQTKFGVTLKYEGGKTAHMDKSTLKKGASTIVGMSEQWKDQTMVQGFNYANPAFNRKAKPTLYSLERDLKSGNLSSGYSVPPALTHPGFDSEEDRAKKILAINKAGLESRRKVRQSEKIKYVSQSFGTNPNVDIANRIRKDIGLRPITYKTVRKGKGRYTPTVGVWDSTGKYLGDKSPEGFLTDHYKKESVVDWAKDYGLKMKEDDTIKVRGRERTQLVYSRSGGKIIGRSIVDITKIKEVKAKTKPQKTVVLYDRFQRERDVKKEKYQKFYTPLESEDQAEYDLLDKKIKGLISKHEKSIASKHTSFKRIKLRGHYQTARAKSYEKSIELDKKAIVKIKLENKKDIDRMADIKENQEMAKYRYYTISSDDFVDMQKHKDTLIDVIESRRSNQQSIIDTLNLTTSTIKKESRIKRLIPTLESTHDKLDTKKDILKSDIMSYNWRPHISKTYFGSDKIQGESHVGVVIDDIGGIRDNFWAQDVRKLVKKTKLYEGGLKEKITEKEKQYKDIVIAEDDSLVETYNKKQSKEMKLAEKVYLERSLTETMKQREEIDKKRKEKEYYDIQNVQAAIVRTPTNVRGRQSLKTFSQTRRSNLTKKRTRGGRNTLGGLVI